MISALPGIRDASSFRERSINPVMAIPYFNMNLWIHTPDILLLQPIFLRLNQSLVAVAPNRTLLNQIGPDTAAVMTGMQPMFRISATQRQIRQCFSSIHWQC